MARVVRADTRVFFFDLPRSKQGEFIQCDFLEELKNGHVSTPRGHKNKQMKFEAVPHVAVFVNEHPDHSKMSEDKHSVTVLWLQQSVCCEVLAGEDGSFFVF